MQICILYSYILYVQRWFFDPEVQSNISFVLDLGRHTHQQPTIIELALQNINLFKLYNNGGSTRQLLQ